MDKIAAFPYSLWPGFVVLAAIFLYMYLTRLIRIIRDRRRRQAGSHEETDTATEEGDKERRRMDEMCEGKGEVNESEIFLPVKDYDPCQELGIGAVVHLQHA